LNVCYLYDVILTDSDLIYRQNWGQFWIRPGKMWQRCFAR